MYTLIKKQKLFFNELIFCGVCILTIEVLKSQKLIDYAFVLLHHCS